MKQMSKVGENAIFSINGLDTERHSNTFDINGVTFTLKGEFDATTPVSLNVNTDTNIRYCCQILSMTTTKC
ncbi:flagellar filament capping protein FliD [Anaerobacillus sp. HL2]|nr:flagellar filament capping protein FliD [Anaerobacillus sp. HL2]